MEGFRTDFIEGAEAKGVRMQIAERVFEQVTAFSEFGFPKSHAAAFGLLAYQSAWLRYYYPVEYNTALFNNQPMGFYSLDVLTRDAERHGVKVMLPDINASDVYCTVESGALRIGLSFVRDAGVDVMEATVVERENNGSFRCLSDFIRRAPPTLSRDAIENLVWVGACDCFGMTRRELLWQVGLWLPPKNGAKSARRVRRQLELPLNHPYEGLRFAGVKPDERMVAEYQMLGFAASGHPFSLLEDALPPDRVRCDELQNCEHDATLTVAGLVVARQRPETAKGFVFVLLEDETGMINVIVRPDVHDRYRVAIRGEPYLLVEGKLAKDDGALNVIATELRPLTVKRKVPSFETSAQSPYRFLKDLRRSPPPAKSWG